MLRLHFALFLVLWGSATLANDLSLPEHKDVEPQRTQVALVLGEPGSLGDATRRGRWHIEAIRDLAWVVLPEGSGSLVCVAPPLAPLELTVDLTVSEPGRYAVTLTLTSEDRFAQAFAVGPAGSAVPIELPVDGQHSVFAVVWPAP